VGQTTESSKFIRATAKKVYEAFTNPKSLEAWLAPGNMTGKIHSFDLRGVADTGCRCFIPNPKKK